MRTLKLIAAVVVVLATLGTIAVLLLGATVVASSGTLPGGWGPTYLWSGFVGLLGLAAAGLLVRSALRSARPPED